MLNAEQYYLFDLLIHYGKIYFDSNKRFNVAR